VALPGVWQVTRTFELATARLSLRQWRAADLAAFAALIASARFDPSRR